MRRALKRGSRKSKNGDAFKSPQVSVVIETPKGSRNKLKYDSSKRMFKLSKVMPEGMVFPFDFGFVPDTKAEDGDPLDILVLTDDALFPGCVVDCVLAGVIEAEQKDNDVTKRNDRLIAVAKASVLYSKVRDLADLNPMLLKQIDAFFINYQKVRDIQVNILGHRGSRKALELLNRSANQNVA